MSLNTAAADTSEADKQIVFLRGISKDFRFEQVSPKLFYEDSRALIVVMTENPENRKASRHVDTWKHFIGQLVEDKTIVSEKCGKMVMDIQFAF